MSFGTYVQCMFNKTLEELNQCLKRFHMSSSLITVPTKDPHKKIFGDYKSSIQQIWKSVEFHFNKSNRKTDQKCCKVLHKNPKFLDVRQKGRKIA